MVTVEREGTTLHLIQERFTYLQAPSDQEWLIPVSVRVFYENGPSRDVNTLLDAKRGIVDIGTGAVAYKLNDGQNGFYRVRYRDKDNFRQLCNRVTGKELPPVDRWGIQNDLYAMVKRGDAKMEDYLDFLSHYAEEDASLPLSSIAANLHHAFVLLEGNSRRKIAAAGRTLFEKVLESIGYEPGPQDKHTTSILRDQILWQAALYGSTRAETFCMTQFSLLLQDRKVHPDIQRSVMQVGASCGTRETFEWFMAKIESSESEHERMNMLVAVGGFKDGEVLEGVKRYVLEEVPDRNKFIPIGVMCENPVAIPSLWDWYRTNLEAFERFHPVHHERVIAALVPISGLGREEEVRSFFQEYMKKQVKMKDVVKLSLERLEIHSRMRQA
jgi:ERAP1-like C-terminal domain